MEAKQTERWRWWLLLTIVAQIGWGTYPVFLRYLQTVSRIPSLSLLAFANGLMFLTVGSLMVRRLERRYFLIPTVWFFIVVALLRAVTNLLATRHTLAIYVQLIALATPFFVALISRLFLGERLPRYTLQALVICLLGALMMIGQRLGGGQPAGAPFRNDLLGITLAVVSAMALATYMILIRRSRDHQVPSSALVIVNYFVIMTVTAGVSLSAGESWAVWRTLAPTDWAAFFALCIVVLLLANWGQMGAIQRIGAPLVSSTMSLRLISTLVVGALLLGERLTSIWQFVGAAIVIVTISWYLRQQ